MENPKGTQYEPVDSYYGDPDAVKKESRYQGKANNTVQYVDADTVLPESPGKGRILYCLTWKEHIKRDRHYWNERFQQIIEKVAITPEEIRERNYEIEQLLRSFKKVALPIAEKIISGGIVKDKSFGGIAGGWKFSYVTLTGDKFMDKHMFLKLAVDPPYDGKFLYGGDERCNIFIDAFFLIDR